jgi:hypothetical protein
MAVDEDFFALRAPRQEERARLEAIFRADSALERARGLRLLVVQLLAAFAFPVWLIALWPSRFSPGFRDAALGAWGAGLLVVLLALAHEARCRHRRARGMATLPRAVLKSPSAACASGPEAES